MDLSSDHHLMFFDFLLHVKLTGLDRRTVFNFHLADWNGLQRALDQYDLSPSKSTDINTDWEQWKYFFLSVAAEHIPLKTFKRRNTPPWFDGEVRRLLSKKDSCGRKAKRKLCTRLWEKFCILRRSAKSLVRAKRMQYLSLSSIIVKVKQQKVLVSV